MCYWDLIDNMSLSELFDFLEYRNSYKNMMGSYEDVIVEEEQLRYLEEKENV